MWQWTVTVEAEAGHLAYSSPLSEASPCWQGALNVESCLKGAARCDLYVQFKIDKTDLSCKRHKFNF